MSDEAAILSAIAAHPDEDTPRLAYADWLDDHAADLPDPQSARIRAEFIRVQCELKKYEDAARAEQDRYVELYRRQDAIITNHRRELLGPLGTEMSEVEMNRDVVFDRGFVTELRLDAVRFIEHADAIAAFKPLPGVTVRDAARWLPRLLENHRHVAIIAALYMQSDRRPEPLEMRQAEDLWRQELRQPAVWWRLFAEDRPWDRLRELDLEGCRIGDDGITGLASDGQNLCALTHLDLSGNEISDAGVQSLVNSPLWPRLKNLVLGANPISDEGAFALADAPPTALAYLNLRFTGIGQDGRVRLLRRKGWKVDLF